MLPRTAAAAAPWLAPTARHRAGHPRTPWRTCGRPGARRDDGAHAEQAAPSLPEPVLTAARPVQGADSSPRNRARRRERHRQSRTATRRVTHDDGAARGLDHLAHDREAEPGAAVVAGPRLVEPHEPLEHPAPLLLRNARPVVVDNQDHAVVLLVEGDRDPVARVADRVGEEVAHRLPEQHRMTGDLPGAHAGDVDPGAAVAQPPRLHEHQVVEVDRPVVARRRRVVESGQHEQRVDQVLHPLLLGEHVGGQVGRGDPPGVALGDLGELAQGRQRRPQLVGGVAHELPLQALRGVDPVQHLVQRAREPGDLVVAGRDREPSVEVGGGDDGGLAAHRLHRAQGTADAHPDGDGQQRERQGHRDAEQDRRRAGRLGHLLGGAPDRDQAGPVHVRARPPRRTGPRDPSRAHPAPSPGWCGAAWSPARGRWRPRDRRPRRSARSRRCVRRPRPAWGLAVVELGLHGGDLLPRRR